MSILVGPFEENTKTEQEQEEDEDLLVFGYSCKLYRDDAKALLEDSGALLIPWMGDSSLMIDRYFVRGSNCSNCHTRRVFSSSVRPICIR